MKELKIIKSANFGDIQCDIYSNGRDFYMTREQVGRSLEYSEPLIAISKVHDRHSKRLDLPKFSVVTKLVSTDGKAYDTTVYTRKGIMEICRHSNQPKADAFMDWVWDTMDSLISGETKLVPTRRSLSETNTAAKIILQTLKEAGMSPQFRAVAVQSLYAPVGVSIPLEGITVDKKLYDATTIAKRLGVMSKSGKPHKQAIAAIISVLDLSDDERVLVPFQNQHSGHSGSTPQYTESVIDKVLNWLEQNGYPAVIQPDPDGKKYGVRYECVAV